VVRIDEHIRELRANGVALADVVKNASLEAPVPTCPGWQLRDLVHHLGGVHRWATAFVSTGRATPIKEANDLESYVGGWPPDIELVSWFEQGHAALVAALESAPDDLECWSFLPAPSPRAFWARRQAHETAIHRADADAAAGARSVFPSAFAADGVEELLFGFGGRRGAGMRTEVERSMVLRATDLDAVWHVRLTPGDRGEVVTAGENGDAECEVAAPASDLYLLLWNRRGVAGLRVEGDAEVLGLWRDQVQIRWN
jgi:uncharacterized protein (TIGR03083 family)